MNRIIVISKENRITKPILTRFEYVNALGTRAAQIANGAKILIKNAEELEKWTKENPNKKFELNRMKGLGEMSVEETEETLTSPTGRILKQITVEDVTVADKLFEDLMGTGISARKEYIKNHSEEAGIYNAE